MINCTQEIITFFADAPALHNEVDELIKNATTGNNCKSMEEDLIILFNNLIDFFTGKEEDMANLNSMSKKERYKLLQELKNLIDMLKSIQSIEEKHDLIAVLGQRLIKIFSKKEQQKSKLTTLEREKERKKFEKIFASLRNYNLRRQQLAKLVKDGPKLHREKFSRAESFSHNVRAKRNKALQRSI